MCYAKSEHHPFHSKQEHIYSQLWQDAARDNKTGACSPSTLSSLPDKVAAGVASEQVLRREQKGKCRRAGHSAPDDNMRRCEVV